MVTRDEADPDSPTASSGAPVSCRHFGIPIGRLPSGRHNAITDVEGVLLGHVTVGGDDPAIQTGVTVVRPHPADLFREKLVASCHVINGFGKSVGLMQVAELGQLESPIVLTNTFSVAAAIEGLVDHFLHQGAGRRGLVSMNPVVLECNDSFLNDIEGRHVRRDHITHALATARPGAFQQGAVGAGRGMSAYDLKGGIGSASRVVSVARADVTVGVLVLANFGTLDELVIAGLHVGRVLGAEYAPEPLDVGIGSLIVCVATDAPLSDRQLGRLLRRAQNGIARTGSDTSHHSGEVVIGFTTAGRIPHGRKHGILALPVLSETALTFDPLFKAVAEATEEAILNSMFNAQTVVGRDGARRDAFPIDRLPDLMRKARATT